MEIYLFAAILPVLLLCYYIYKKDVNPEPNRVLWKIFFYGCLTCIPIIFFELVIQKIYPLESASSFLSLFLNIFVSVAFIEEGFKWIVTRKFGYDIKEFDEIYDIIVYAVFASLGFACVENILYVCKNGLGNALLRAFTSVPGHTCFGVIMGYYFSKAKTGEVQKKHTEYLKNMILSISIPVILHTLYDTILLYSAQIESFLFIIIFLIFISIMFIVCFKIVGKVSSENQKIYYSPKDEVISEMLQENLYKDVPSSKNDIHFCSNCGNNVEGCNYCASCGQKIREM